MTMYCAGACEHSLALREAATERSGFQRRSSYTYTFSQQDLTEINIMNFNILHIIMQILPNSGILTDKAVENDSAAGSCGNSLIHI